jgi:hypothetical protein
MPTPDTYSSVILEQLDAVDLVRDVYDGTLALRAKGQVYLPKFEREQLSDYGSRVSQSVLYNAVDKTVEGLTGMVFRKDITVGGDVPEEILPHIENIDQTGRHLSVFAADVFQSGMIDGISFVLVDYPTVGEGQFITRAEEEGAGLRPYWVQIGVRDVRRIRWAVVDGRMQLTQFAYLTRTIEGRDDFTEVVIVRVRQWSLINEGGVPRVVLDVWRQEVQPTETIAQDGSRIGAGSEWIHEVVARPLGIDMIPVHPFYGKRRAYMVGVPPLLDLALEDILHYQVRSDRQNVLHIASVPIPHLAGVDTQGGSITVGPYEAIITSEGGKAQYMEPRGYALGESRAELQDIEQRMGSLGLAMLQRDTRASETAEAKRMDRAAGDSQLARAARSLQDCLESCLYFHATWMGLPDGGSVDVNRDYDNATMDANLVRALSELEARGQLTLRTLLTALKTGEVIPDSVDVDEELVSLEVESVETLAEVRRRDVAGGAA